MTLWNFPYFWKTILDQSLWIFNRVRWWCHTLTIFYTFHLQKMTKISFSGKHKQIHPSIYWKWMRNYFCSDIFQNRNILLPASAKKVIFFTFSCMMCVINCEGVTSSLHLMNIHRDWSRSVFRKYGKIQKFITSIFLIRFSWFLYHFVGKIFLFFMKWWKCWSGFTV